MNSDLPTQPPTLTVSVSYAPNGAVLPVEALAAIVRSYIGGYGDVRIMETMIMETMIQDIAARVREIVRVDVCVVGDLIIDPGEGEPKQKMRVTASVFAAQAVNAAGGMEIPG